MKKKILAVLSIGLIIGLFIGLLLRTMPRFTIYSIKDIQLIKSPTLENGKWTRGVWRVYADTKDTSILKMTLKEWEINKTQLAIYGAINSSMAVQSSLYVKVELLDKPYWLLNIEHIGDYIVTPKVCGAHYWRFDTPLYSQWGLERDEKVVVDSINASVYRIKGIKALVVPFAVTAIKKSISGDIMLVTDYPCAQKEEANKRWLIVIEGDLAKYDAFPAIEFYNPNNRKENFTLMLQHYTGYFAPYIITADWSALVVTETGLDVVVNGVNVFEDYLNDIEKIIRWDSQNPWKYASYWFGGTEGDSAVFKGTASWSTNIKGPITVWKDESKYKGSPTGCIDYYTLPGVCHTIPLAEGYIYSEPKDIWEYPGWYKPHDTTEGPTTDDDWQNRIYPRKPDVFINNNTTKPFGYSLVNYIASKDVIAPVTRYKKGDVGVVVNRKNLDIWGNGYFASLNSAYCRIYCPRNSWCWAFTLDVSTDIVDTIYVIEEPRAKPKIIDLKYPTEKLVQNIEYPIVAKLKNEGETGEFGIGLNIGNAPLRVKGTGYYEIEKGAQINVTIYVENLGTLSKDTDFVVKLLVGNKYEYTDERKFVLTLGAGVGVEKTSVIITTIDAETKSKVNGLNVEVKTPYGEFYDIKTTDTSRSGTAIFDLGYYEGKILVTVTDPSGVYLKTDTREYTVKQGSNLFPIEVYRSPTENLLEFIIKYLPYIIGGCIGVCGLGIVVYSLKKRREYGGIRY